MKRKISFLLSVVMLITSLNYAYAEENDLLRDFISNEDNIITPSSVDYPDDFENEDYGIATASFTVPEIGESNFIEPVADMPYIKDNGFIEDIEYNITDDYIPISTAEDLANIRDNGKYYLTQDIDLSTYNNGIWEPIVVENNKYGSFAGIILEGCGHKIYNLNVPISENIDIASLLCIGYPYSENSNYIFRNIGLENVNVTGSEIACGLVTINYDSNANDLTDLEIYNCYVNGNIAVYKTGSDITTYARVAGICVDRYANAKILSCYSSGTLYCSGKQCDANGIALNIASPYNAGGSSSTLRNPDSIDKTINMMNINIHCIQSASAYVSGIGYFDRIEKCINAGNISIDLNPTKYSSNTIDVGGIANKSTDIMNCYSSGDIYIMNNMENSVNGNIGGIIGSESEYIEDGECRIYNSYSTGNITTYNSGRRIGGIAGCCLSINKSYSTSIIYDYNIGGVDEIGGIATSVNSIEDSYYEGEIILQGSLFWVGGLSTYVNQCNNCRVNCDISCDSSVPHNVSIGGIVYRCGITYAEENEVNIKNSTYEGNISVKSNDYNIYNENDRFPFLFDIWDVQVGGICATTITGENVKIYNCMSKGTIYTENCSMIGGIISNCRVHNLENCKSYMNINVVNGGKIGGIAAETCWNIKNCDNYGNITSSDTDNSCVIGGLIGSNERLDLTEDATQTIENCNSYGKISYSDKKENDYIGGMIGRLKVGRRGSEYYENQKFDELYDQIAEFRGKNYYASQRDIVGALEKTQYNEAKIIGTDSVKYIGSDSGSNGDTTLKINGNIVKYAYVGTPITINATYSTQNSSDKYVDSFLNSISWTLSDAGIAEGISEDRNKANNTISRTFRPIKEGSSVLTVKADDGAQASCVLLVMPEIKQVDTEYNVLPYYPELDNSTVKVGKNGTAVIYASLLNSKNEPVANQSVTYTLNNGESYDTTITDSNGVFDIRIPNVSSDMDITVSLAEGAGVVYNNTNLFYKIEVDDLVFSKIFSGKVESSVYGNTGATLEFGPIELSEIKSGVSIGSSRRFGIGYNQSPGNTDLTLSVDRNPYKAGVNASIGLGSKIKNTSVEVGIDAASGDFDYSKIDGYTITLKDYFDKNSPEYRENAIYAALTVFDVFLSTGTGLKSKVLTKINNKLMDLVETKNIKDNITTKDGIAVSFSQGGASVNVSYGNLKGTFSGNKSETVTSFTESKKGDKSSSRTLEETFTEAADFFKLGFAAKNKNSTKISTSIGKIKTVDYDTTKQFKVDYDTKDKAEKINYSVEYPVSENPVQLFGNTDITRNSFEAEVSGSLFDKLVAENADIKKYVDKDGVTISENNMENLLNILGEYNDYSNYKDNESNTKTISLPLSIGIGAGVTVGLDANISGAVSSSYTTGEGVFNKNGIKETGVYDDYSWAKNYNLLSFLDPIEDILKDYVTDVVDNVVEAGANIGASILGMAKITPVETDNKNRKVTISRVKDDDIATVSNDVIISKPVYNILRADQLQEEDNIGVAKSFGDTFIVNVSDENGNYIEDFEDTPMKLELSYAEVDISKLTDSQISNVAIYKWDNTEGLYNKLESNVDLTNKTVSATITKSGEYMLCLDTTKPTIKDFKYTPINSIFGRFNATFNSDFSSISVYNIKLLVDGEERNLYLDCYDPSTGEFEFDDFVGVGDHVAVLTVEDSSGNLSDAAIINYNVEDIDSVASLINAGTLTTENDYVVAYEVYEYVQDIIDDLTVVYEDKNGIKKESKAIRNGNVFYAIIPKDDLYNNMSFHAIPHGKDEKKYIVSADEYNYNRTFILVNSSNGGNATGTGVYDSSDFVEFRAVPDSGYHFVGWYVNDKKISSIPIYKTKADEGGILNAVFEKDGSSTTTTVTETSTQATTTTVTSTQTTTKAPITQPTTTTVTDKSTETTTKAVVTETGTETTTKKDPTGGRGPSGGGGGSSSSSNKTTTTEATTEATTSKSASKSEPKTEATTAAPALSNVVKVTIGNSSVVIGNKEYTVDAAPYIQTASNSTLVPLRFVALAIAGGDVSDADNSKSVTWDAITKTATISFGGTIQFTAGNNVMTVNGKQQTMDNGVKAEITDGRMFVPFRALGNALGVQVDWDADTKTAVYSAK